MGLRWTEWMDAIGGCFCAALAVAVEYFVRYGWLVGWDGAGCMYAVLSNNLISS